MPVALIAGAEPLARALQPYVASLTEQNLPFWLIKWGHPGNMAVVLLAMGGYGSYLGWRIRLSSDVKEKQAAMSSHPKLAIGMTIFFTLGAFGGITALLMQGKPIFESTHVWTGLLGLSLLFFQAMLPLFFKDDPSTRGLHAYLGSGIMALFVVHGFLGLKLGLSL